MLCNALLSIIQVMFLYVIAVLSQIVAQDIARAASITLHVMFM